MKYILTILLFTVSACASDPNVERNPKDIPVDTGAKPQSNVIISAPPGTMGHGRF